jgi:hypothetical protein
MASELCRDYEEWKGLQLDCFFFFLDNHPEYFEKVIKSIAKGKYRNIKKKRIHLEKQKEKKKTNLLQ